MKPRQQRMLAVGLAAAGVLIATLLTLRADKWQNPLAQSQPQRQDQREMT